MVKKILFISLALFGLLFSTMPPACFADAAAQLQQAETYKQNEQYEQAEAIYRGIVTDYPGTDEAFQAQKSLALLYIKTARYPAARQEVDVLLTNFAYHPELPGEVYKLAEQYWRKKRYEDAKSLYEYIAENHSDSDLAIKARRSVVVADILLGNDAAAQAGIDGLIADFADHPELPGEVYKIEAQYWHMKRYEDVKLLCEYIAENHSDSDFAIKARASVAGADILLGNDAAAQAGVDTLIRDFAEDPELAGMLWKLGNISWERGKYGWSRQLYQHTFETDPQGPLAIKARRSVVVADILLGNDAAAQAGIDGLITDFADHPELPGEVYKIEAQYWHMKRYEDVKLLCEYIAENHSDSDLAIKARASVAAADILLGNDAAAQAGVDALIRDFAEDPELAGMLWKLGNISCEGGKYDRAAELYQYVIDNWPKTEHEMRAKTGVAKLNISLGNDAAVEATIDILIADFNDHPALPEAVFIIGEQYYNEAFRCENEGLETEARDYFRKAIAVWEGIITELPPSNPYTAHAYNFSAICYRRMGEYEKAIEYFQKIVHDYPDYDYADYAQFVVGRIYGRLKKIGRMSSSEANTKIVQAYENILQKYPDSKWVKPAQNQLEWIRKKASHKEKTNEE